MTASDRARICLVEDDPIMGESLCDRLRLEGFAFDWFRSAGDAYARLPQGAYAAVVSDIRLPDFGGDELFKRLRATGGVPPFLFITGFGSIDRAVELLKLGAADYITKPFDLDELIEKLRALCGPAAAGGRVPVLGISAAMRRIEDLLPRIAKRAGSLLITGESGVGKERVAQEFDRLARDNEKCPFVAINCGAVAEGLLEAELFGHEKGAFTGAMRQKKGVFELADCGTLFLDEIGEMSLAMQVKLLRALQEKRFRRVGGEVPVDVDLRVICATNRNLKELVEHGRFREDLYYRVNVIHVPVPPLRERKDDILWLARKFLDEFSSRHGGGRRELSPAAEHALLDYPWPGNVRELRHCIERGSILASRPVLGPEDFFGDGLPPRPEDTSEASLNDYLAECERRYIRQALERHDGHIANTAAALGISRKGLWEKLKRLGIEQRA
jgi:DNA-binding NtrC family response regulator